MENLDWWVAPIGGKSTTTRGTRKEDLLAEPVIGSGLGVAVAAEEGASAQKISAGPMGERAASVASLAGASISLRPITQSANRTLPPFRPLRPLPPAGGTVRGRIGESDFPAQLGEE